MFNFPYQIFSKHDIRHQEWQFSTGLFYLVFAASKANLLQNALPKRQFSAFYMPEIDLPFLSSCVTRSGTSRLNGRTGTTTPCHYLRRVGSISGSRILVRLRRTGWDLCTDPSHTGLPLPRTRLIRMVRFTRSSRNFTFYFLI
jgi:hypothetical protein